MGGAEPGAGHCRIPVALDLTRRDLIGGSLVVACLLVSACASTTQAQSVAAQSAQAQSGSTSSPESVEATASPEAKDSSVVAARQGSAADSERLRFRPVEVEMPDGSTAPVQPAPTANGELVIPEDIFRLGWWDGGAYVNDPFGSTVIAGHIDSKEQGIGYFGKLLNTQVDDVITVRGEEGELSYRVVSTELIDKDVLATESAAFDQSTPHRLVLITCSGRWQKELGSYESNFVVTAEPIGLAR